VESHPLQRTQRMGHPSNCASWRRRIPMKGRLAYRSGEEIRSGDQITYHDEPGKIEFLVAGKVGDPAMDWYAEQFPGGGFMIAARNFGNVFLTESGIDEDLKFVARG
jgi:hypothetical protein